MSRLFLRFLIPVVSYARLSSKKRKEKGGEEAEQSWRKFAANKTVLEKQRLIFALGQNLRVPV